MKMKINHIAEALLRNEALAYQKETGNNLGFEEDNLKPRKLKNVKRSKLRKARSIAYDMHRMVVCQFERLVRSASDHFVFNSRPTFVELGQYSTTNQFITHLVVSGSDFSLIIHVVGEIAIISSRSKVCTSPLHYMDLGICRYKADPNVHGMAALYAQIDYMNGHNGSGFGFETDTIFRPDYPATFTEFLNRVGKLAFGKSTKSA